VNALLADEEPTDRGSWQAVPVELVWLPTLVPHDSLDPDELVSVAETVVLRPPSPLPPRPRRAWLFAVPFLGGITLGGASALVVLGAGVALLGLIAAVTLLVQRPGGAEQLVGEVLNRVRQEYPGLIVPIEELEIFVQHAAYETTLMWTGAPAQEPTFVLPPELIAGPPDIPDGGPHEVPAVTFDPALLSQPLLFFPVKDGPQWMTVSRPVLNEAFPDDHALVLKFDMRHAELHWMPGRKDPWPMLDHQMLPDAVPAPDRSGRVPMEARTGPFVVFGGGFQSLHFPSFGARWQGRDIIRMRQGIQTAAIYQDGHVEIGPWGTLSQDGLVEARQNLPPLVHEGKIPANIAYLNVGTMSAEPLEEGGVRTYTNVHTWRSAMGIRPDGDLVYVLAARVAPQQLAATLIRAGVVEGMQLDINAAWHASPTLATPHPDAKGYDDVDTKPLFTGVEDGGRRFVRGADRDFFYLVQR
jgi:hypothetical protein